jgi:hypothetical protein
MLKALANVAPRHLLDTRLNPPADLHAAVKPEAVEGISRVIPLLSLKTIALAPPTA